MDGQSDLQKRHSKAAPEKPAGAAETSATICMSGRGAINSMLMCYTCIAPFNTLTSFANVNIPACLATSVFLGFDLFLGPTPDVALGGAAFGAMYWFFARRGIRKWQNMQYGGQRGGGSRATTKTPLITPEQAKKALGLDPNVDSYSNSQVMAAFRKKAKRFHPDVNTSKDASEMFKTLNNSRDFLMIK